MTRYNGRMVIAEIWPFHPSMFKHSSPAAWPHESNKPNGPLVLYFVWDGEDNDEFWIARLKEALERIRQVALDEKCTTEGAAVHGNTALAEVTSVEDIYRDNLDRLRDLRKKYDPFDVMA